MSSDKKGGSVEVKELESLQPAVHTVQRGLKSRHIQLLALGAAIGTGLFVGSGAVLSITGPAPLFISYIVMSFFVWLLMNQMGEMVCYLPLAGECTIYALARRYGSKSMSFAAGWNMYYAQVIIVPTEITAAAFVIQYWNDRINVAAWISIFMACSAILGCLPVKYFGESEFAICSLKIICLSGLIILGVVLFFGGGPAQHGVLGFHYWKHGGAFAEHLVPGNTGKFLACWTAIIRSGFSFVLTPELLASTAGEVQFPRRNMKKAISRFVYRLAFFYVCGSLVIGIIVGKSDARLMGALDAGSQGAGASPFVIGIINAGIPVLNHIINAVILTSAFSCGNGFIFGSSRVLHSLAKEGNAPAIFAKCNKHGTPVYAIILGVAISALAYLNVSSSSATVFAWFTNLATVSGFVSWIFVPIVYLRFRKAIEYHGMQDRIPYRPPLQKSGAYACIFFFSLLTLTNGYAVFFPQNWNASDFVAAYVTIPIVGVLYLGYMIYKREWQLVYPTELVDVVTGLEEVESMEASEKFPEPRNWVEKVWMWAC